MTEIPDIGRLARSMLHNAKRGAWNGKELTPYFKTCRWDLLILGAEAIFTRDVGHHSGGWWKNPDYERCYHLSLSFFGPETRQPKPRDKVLTSLFIEALYGKDKRFIWCEPPYSGHGKLMDIWHYRLFCDPAWEAIKPRGEVYSRELTEAGWKSFSDVQSDLQTE